MVQTIQRFNFFIHPLFEDRAEIYVFGRIEDTRIFFGGFLTFNYNTELIGTLEPLLQTENSSNETKA